MSRRVVAISSFAIAALVAACGGGAPTTTGGAGSSFAPDPELEALFPDSVNGQPLRITSAKGEDVIPAFGNQDSVEIQSLITDLGATMDQVSAAISFNLWPGATATEFT